MHVACVFVSVSTLHVCLYEYEFVYVHVDLYVHMCVYVYVYVLFVRDHIVCVYVDSMPYSLNE